MRRIRQRERRQRWQDTPQYIMKSDFCFISSTWMAEWEMFVEGWQTHRPERVIDQHGLLTSIMSLNRVGTNPFYLNSNDLVMIISGQTWDYLVREYGLRGEKISQEDLVPEENYLKIIHRIAYWKKRAGACS
ncbi:uncharacterized protein EV154DRAFT_424568 [Mucor mucedo]|nr:uncharacterized protein EV154DRAFT_424568 [Mucor mucedo]KAI7889099.1 hypothetical protein EV154DRAFT_424568 [Mucor mucedo]